MNAAIVYWRWLGEEFPRYARAVSTELTALKGRRIDPQEAAARISRLTREYTDVLAELPRRIIEQELASAAAGKAPGRRRRRHGRVID
jgi:hypothetical protein